MQSNFKVVPYGEEALRDALVRGSHEGDPDVRSKPHADYLHGYLTKIGARAMVVEHGYVDRDYLEDFAAYHVRCFVSYRRECTRLHFFSTDLGEAGFREHLAGRRAAGALRQAYLGFIVVKPLPATVVGRTCLATYESNPQGRRRVFPALRQERANLFGLELSVDSLPFQEQDRDVAACASSALWSALNGSRSVFHNSAPSPVEITKAAGLHLRSHNRHLPAGDGLSSNQMADAIRSVGLEPHAIAAKDSRVLRIAALAYLRAGIPGLLMGDLYERRESGEAVLRGGHAVAVTGYGLPEAPTGQAFHALSVDRLYCHDDQVGPFSRMDFAADRLVTRNQGLSRLYELVPTVLIVPLYHKIRVSVLDIHEVAVGLGSVLRAMDQPSLLPLPGPVTWDIRLMTVSALRAELSASALDDEVKLRLLTRPYPRFIWRLDALHGDRPLFTGLMDATDLMQGHHLISVVPHDPSLCRALAAVIPQIVAGLPPQVRVGRVLARLARHVAEVG